MTYMQVSVRFRREPRPHNVPVRLSVVGSLGGSVLVPYRDGTADEGIGVRYARHFGGLDEPLAAVVRSFEIPISDYFTACAWDERMNDGVRSGDTRRRRET